MRPYRVYNGELVLYYSDQRDSDHGQKLVHQTTTDLLTWSDVVDDVAYDVYDDRPGMPIVAQLPTGDYIFTYERGETYSGGISFAVHYRISADPLDFNSAPDYALVADGVAPSSSPYVVWSSYGGENGTIVVSGGTRDEVFTNQMLGDPDHWQMWPVPEPRSYTRSLMIFEEDPDLLLLIGGGHLPPSSTNVVSLSVVRLSELITSTNSTRLSARYKKAH